MRHLFAGIVLLITGAAASAAGLSDITNRAAVAGKGVQFGLVDSKQATIEQYVTKKALDGLYLIIAEEEKALRQDPVGAASSIVQKIFDALK